MSGLSVIWGEILTIFTDLSYQITFGACDPPILGHFEKNDLFPSIYI